MPPLRIHQHGVGGVRVALPFVPEPLDAPGRVDAVAALQHQAFATECARFRLKPRERVGVVDHQHLGNVEPVALVRGDEALEPRASLRERQRAPILAGFDEKVVGAQEGRILGQHLRGHGLAVEALLQIVERRGMAVGAAHQQLAVDDRVEVDAFEQVGERARDVVAGAREQAFGAVLGDELHAHAIPFPLDLPGMAVELFPVLEGVREHEGAEARRRLGRRARCAIFEPREQRLVRW